jgi:hypothetical protein
LGGLYSKWAVWQKVCAAVCEVAFRSFLVAPSPAPRTMHLTPRANSRNREFTNSRRCSPMQCRLADASDHLFGPRYRTPQMPGGFENYAVPGGQGDGRGLALLGLPIDGGRKNIGNISTWSCCEFLALQSPCRSYTCVGVVG